MPLHGRQSIGQHARIYEQPQFHLTWRLWLMPDPDFSVHSLRAMAVANETHNFDDGESRIRATLQGPCIFKAMLSLGPTGGALLQALFRRGQLKALVDVHSQAEGLGGNLSMEEISIIRGALDLTSKIAIAGMTPLEKVRCPASSASAPPLDASLHAVLLLHFYFQ